MGIYLCPKDGRHGYQGQSMLTVLASVAGHLCLSHSQLPSVCLKLRSLQPPQAIYQGVSLYLLLKSFCREKGFCQKISPEFPCCSGNALLCVPHRCGRQIILLQLPANFCLFGDGHHVSLQFFSFRLKTVQFFQWIIFPGLPIVLSLPGISLGAQHMLCHGLN